MSNVYGNPAFRDGVLYVGGDKLRALRDNGNSASVLWEADIFIRNDITVAGRRLYVPAAGNVPNTINAVDTETGRLDWVSALPSNGPAAVSGNRVYYTSGNRLVILEDQGDRFATVFVSDPLAGTLTPPAINVAVAAASDTGEVYAFDPATGQILWTRTVDAVFRAAPAIDDERIYLVDETQRVHSFEREMGTFMWATDLPGQPVTVQPGQPVSPGESSKTPTPAVLKDVIVVPRMTDPNTVTVYVLNDFTGQIVSQVNRSTEFGIIIGSPSVFGGVLALSTGVDVFTWIT